MEKGIFLLNVYGKDSTLLRQGTGFFVGGQGQGITNDILFKGAAFAKIISKDSTVHNIRKVVRINPSAGLVQFTIDNNLTTQFFPLKTTYTIPKSGEKVFLIKAESPTVNKIYAGTISGATEVESYGTVLELDQKVGEDFAGEWW